MVTPLLDPSGTNDQRGYSGFTLHAGIDGCLALNLLGVAPKRYNNLTVYGAERSTVLRTCAIATPKTMV
jgi:hypothetical protein